jgi:signal transduction histidine kinase
MDRDAGAMEETLETLLGAFVTGGFGTAAAALALGIVLGWHSARRIGAMSETTRSIIATGLKDRIPLKGIGDEFDMLSADINVMLDRVEGLMEGIRQISSDIAHDLRTPLSRMRHRLESSLRERPATLKSYRGTVKRSVVEADGIIATFNALLRIAQIEGGARRSHFKSVDLSDVLSSLQEVYGPVAEDAGLAFASDIQIGVRVNGDRELLTQLFANLIENSVRHGRRGGRIALTLAECLGQIRATVADNGPGIPQDEREKVFRRLYRMEQSRTTAGHGLGLSLVSAVTDLRGARISLHDNRPGLRVEFDMADCEQAVAAS